MMSPFSSQQLAFIFRLNNANRDKLLKFTSRYPTGVSKAELVRLIIRKATEELGSDKEYSEHKAQEAFRAKLCEEKLANWEWFDLPLPS